MTNIFHGGLFLKKQEMTRLWVDNRFVAVTLATVVEQNVVRHKTQENDWYSALVIEIRGETKTPTLCEIRVEEVDLQTFPVGAPLDITLLEGVATVRLSGVSQGKGFQWVMKRHNFAGGPASHGSKFHRAWWSTGNRKPRRTNKGHPMAGRMGGDLITLRTLPVVTILEVEGQKMIALKGSIPGAYGSLVRVVL
jgi:large subunit ribosomal protein L3